MFNLSKEKLQALEAETTVSEIYQQPQVWAELAADFFKQLPDYQNFVNQIFEKHENVRVIFSGAGTSAFVGDILTPTLNKDKADHVRFESIATTDIVSNPDHYFSANAPTILVSFARSGNSPESLATVELGQKIVKDFYQVVITCNKDGKLAVNVENDDKSLVILMPEKSNDKGLAMTSSFSSMLTAAYGLFTDDFYTQALAEDLTKAGQSLLDEMHTTLNDVLSFDFNRLVYLGSGSLAQLGHEASLKALELTGGQVIATYESSLGFRHGPKSILTGQSLVVLFVSKDAYRRQYDLDILKELSAADNGMKIVALTETRDAEIEALADWTVPVAEDKATFKDDLQLSLLYILFAQGLAVSKSSQLGIAPDNPSPDGEINRVVQGVTIHTY